MRNLPSIVIAAAGAMACAFVRADVMASNGFETTDNYSVEEAVVGNASSVPETAKEPKKKWELLTNAGKAPDSYSQQGGVQLFGAGEAPEEDARPEAFDGVTPNAQYLHLEVENNKVLFNHINSFQDDDGDGNLTFDQVIVEKGLYFDSMMQFTAYDAAENEDAAGLVEGKDKIALWLRKETAGDTPVCRLFVTAGSWDGAKVEVKNYASTKLLKEDTWCRVTVSATPTTVTTSGNVSYGTLSFKIYVDGAQLSATPVGGSGTVNTFLSAESPSSEYATTLTAAGFSGIGALDDVVWTLDNPFPLFVFGVGSDKFELWEDAFAAAKSGGTIKLNMDYGDSGSPFGITIEESATFTLDLNGHSMGALIQTDVDRPEEFDANITVLDTSSGEEYGYLYGVGNYATEGSLVFGRATGTNRFRVEAICSDFAEITIHGGYFGLDSTGQEISGMHWEASDTVEGYYIIMEGEIVAVEVDPVEGLAGYASEEEAMAVIDAGAVVAIPAKVAHVVSDEESYKGLFALKVVDAGDGTYSVVAVFTDEAAEELRATLLDLEARSAAAAAGEDASVGVVTKAGLFYRCRSGGEVKPLGDIYTVLGTGKEQSIKLKHYEGKGFYKFEIDVDGEETP